MKNIIRTAFVAGAVLVGVLVFAQVQVIPSGSGGGSSGSVTGGTCTNQVATAIASSTAAPTCTTITGAYVATNFKTTTIGFTVDGAGSTITTGTKGFIYVPYSGTITGVTLLSTDAAVTSCSIVVDIWNAALASYPPTVANTITASDLPTLSSATNSQDTTLTGWTTAITAGAVLGFHVNSVTSCLRVTLVLNLSKS